MREKYLQKSLCWHLKTSPEGVHSFKRLGDIEDNKITPYYLNMDKRRTFENREIISGSFPLIKPNGLFILDWEEEPVRFYEQPNKVKVNIDHLNTPIQIVSFGKNHDLKQIIQGLKKGLRFNIYSNRFFLCSNQEDDVIDCIYADSDHLEIENSFLTLKDEIDRLPIYEISSDEIIEFWEDMKFYIYEKLNLSKANRYILTKNSNQIIKEILSEQLGWPTGKAMGYSRSTWQEIKKIMSEIPEKEIIEKIKETFICDDEDAEKRLRNFINLSHKFVDEKDINDEIIVNMFENNLNIQSIFYPVAEKKWLGDNAERIEESQEQLSSLKQEISKMISQKEDLLANLNEYDLIIKNKKEEINNLEEVQEELPEKIKKKIESSQQNINDFLSEILIKYPFFNNQNIKTFSESQDSTLINVGRDLIIQEPEICEEWEDVADIFVENLESIGINENYSILVMSYFNAIFKNLQPVLMIGPYGQKLAETISLSLTGKMPGIIDCSKLNKKIINLENNDDKIIVLKNFFMSDRRNDLLELLETEKKMFIITWPLVEDLLVEPKDIFNYMIPFFTEFFFNEKGDGKVIPVEKSNDYEKYKFPSTKQKSIRLKRQYLNNLIFNINNDVLVDTYDFYELNLPFSEQDEINFDYLLYYFPYGFFMGSSENLLNRIDGEESLDTKVAEQLKEFLERF